MPKSNFLSRSWKWTKAICFLYEWPNCGDYIKVGTNTVIHPSGYLLKDGGWAINILSEELNFDRIYIHDWYSSGTPVKKYLVSEYQPSPQEKIDSFYHNLKWNMFQMLSKCKEGIDSSNFWSGWQLNMNFTLNKRHFILRNICKFL